MKGFLGKVIQIFDIRNKQGYKAGMISWIAESVVYNPSAFYRHILHTRKSMNFMSKLRSRSRESLAAVSLLLMKREPLPNSTVMNVRLRGSMA